ncbi:MAG: hypothetical protein ABI607_14260 [Betaproteobacteria bacterium]
MRRIARLVTICLLLMAVPVKGAVAAGMVICDSGHEHMTVPVYAASADVTGESVDSRHHDHGSHQHASMDGGNEGDAAGAVDHPLSDKHGAVKCSICAACCVGGAFLTSAQVVVPVSVGTETSFPALAVRFSGTILAGLERPPRSFLV